MPKNIYLDYAAATPVDPRVVRKMQPFFTLQFANPMSLHSMGQAARQAVEESRAAVAELIGAQPAEIIFTSSASESNNLALKGVAWANQRRGKHIIISPLEHPCIMETAKWLVKQGWEISKLPVDKYGMVNPVHVRRAMRPDTVLVSVMHASNEIGTIEPVAAIGKICRGHGVYFHTDAAQSFGKIPINVTKMNIDLLTASAHKMYGPKGAACLYVRRGVKLEPLLHGGGQEFGLRSSTLNVPAVVGFAAACQICKKEMKAEARRLKSLRDELIKGVLRTIPGATINGHPTDRLPNNANFSIPRVEGESIVMHLDFLGIAASTGSACSSDKLEPSHVLLALGLSPQQAHGSLRVSLGRWTTAADVGAFLRHLPKVVQKLQAISPLK